jgi:endoglucanase
MDKSSGLEVHTIDFSDFDTPGEGYRLTVGGETSPPFSISHEAYASLRKDALSYFYKVRSGIEIEAEFAGKAYARPAGHLGTAPIAAIRRSAAWTPGPRGKSTARPGAAATSSTWPVAGMTPVISANTWSMAALRLHNCSRAMNAHCITAAAGHRRSSDRLVRIPEAGNGLPDILDEARWELDFLVSMMVPEGEPFAGMAHHKMHGNRWTIGPILPHRDREERVLHRPSTAATLNLAAAAAQGARLFARHDPAYAQWLLAAAIRAYQAAEANPKLYAPVTNGTFGGGDYSDDDVSDEFYWAASELYLTTGDAAWLTSGKSLAALVGSGVLSRRVQLAGHRGAGAAPARIGAFQSAIDAISRRSGPRSSRQPTPISRRSARKRSGSCTAPIRALAGGRTSR